MAFTTRHSNTELPPVYARENYTLTWNYTDFHFNATQEVLMLKRGATRLRHYATTWKVASLNSDGVIGIFY